MVLPSLLSLSCLMLGTGVSSDSLSYCVASELSCRTEMASAEERLGMGFRLFGLRRGGLGKEGSPVFCV